MKKCKECGREEWGFLSALNEDGYCPTCAIKNNQDKIKRLQEQIEEANEMLKGAKHLTVKDSNGAVMFELVSPEINEYLKKWGVK